MHNFQYSHNKKNKLLIKLQILFKIFHYKAIKGIFSENMLK